MGYLSDGFRAYGELTAYPSGNRELQGLSGFRNSEPLLFPQLYFPSQALSTGLFQINVFLVDLFLSENRDKAREVVSYASVKDRKDLRQLQYDPPCLVLQSLKSKPSEEKGPITQDQHSETAARVSSRATED